MQGHRGRSGELTVKVVSGDAARWAALREVRLAAAEQGEQGTSFRVECCRTYRDRLVLKLRGIDDATAAHRLRGLTVWAPAAQVPALPEGTFYRRRLIGLEVIDVEKGAVGRVREVQETAGADLLVVDDRRGGEILVPMVREMIVRIDEQRGEVEVRLPAGLAELNRAGEPAT